MVTPDPHQTNPSGSSNITGNEPSTREETGARQKTRETMHRARNELRSLSEQARQQAIRTKDQAKSQGREFLTERKNRVGDEIHQVGDAVRRAGDEFRERGDGYLCRYTDAVADTADRAAGYIWGHDIDDFAAEVQDFTRRHPEIVFGGLFIAGLAAARFLKASMPEPQRPARQIGGPESYPDEGGYAVTSGEAATTYQPPEVYPASTPGRI